MAKVKDLVEQQRQAQADAADLHPVQAPAPPEPASPQAAPEELAFLRAEVERLRLALLDAQSRQAPAAPLSTAHAPGRYLVSLPGFKVRLASYTVEPREKTPAEAQGAPSRTYAGQELFAGGSQHDLQRAAWERYRGEQGLSDSVRKQYRVLPNPGGIAESLEVEAVTEADAFETFRRYSGIQTTERQPKIEKVA